MIRTSIKITGSGGLHGLSDPRVSLNDDGFLTLGQERMQDLGDFAIATIKARARKAIGSDDAPMPPLKVHRRAGTSITIHGQKRTLLGYPQWKVNHGLQPIRDLTGTGKDGGNMLDNISIRTVAGSSLTIAITARKARQKALANEKRAAWFSFSANDTRQIVKFYEQYTGFTTQAVMARILRSVRRAA